MGKNKSNEKTISIITISILLCILLITLIGIFYKTTLNSNKQTSLALAPIKVNISSAEGNHKLEVEVSLNGKSKNLDKLNLESVQSVVRDTMQNLDYDKLIEKDGNEYIKSEVLSNLQKTFGENIESVSLNNFITDVTVATPGDKNGGGLRNNLQDFSWKKKN